MGITGGNRAIRELPAEHRAQYNQRLAEIDAKWPRPNVSDFVNHIDHAVSVIGIDHVGISSDFDGGGGVVGWNDASETFNVTLELVRRGYTEEQIAKIWGQNLLRAWRELEQVARRLQAEGS
jgi:membrane dipeptidase